MNNSENEKNDLKDYAGFPAIEIFTLQNEFIDVLRLKGQWVNIKADYLVCDIDKDGFGPLLKTAYGMDWCIKKKIVILRCGLRTMEIPQKSLLKDNGTGRKAAAELSQESTGKGIRILQGFIEAYTKIQDKVFLMEIIDLFADEGVATGTLVRLGVPITYK